MQSFWEPVRHFAVICRTDAYIQAVIQHYCQRHSRAQSIEVRWVCPKAQHGVDVLPLHASLEVRHAQIKRDELCLWVQ